MPKVPDQRLRRGPLQAVKRFVSAFLFTILSTSLPAEVISWWRFEPSPASPASNGSTNPNDIASEPAIISTNASIGTNAPDLFDTIVPGANVPNTGSILAINQGGSAGIQGKAAYSSTLDVESITVEFWARTNESTAGFVARTTSSNTAESGNISDGFRITDPDNVRVDFWTAENPSGKNSQSTTLTSGISINDGEWHYIVFRYDATSQVAELNVDDATASQTVSGNNQQLFWGSGNSQPEVTIGDLMDGNTGNNNGTLDEIRFSSLAISDDDLLLTPAPVPEPGTLIAGGFLAFFAVIDVYRRFRAKQARDG